MKNVLVVGALSLFLAACGSSVKLDDGAPVESRTGSAATAGAGGAGAGAGSAPQSQVQAVDLAAQQRAAEAAAMRERIVYFDFDSFVVKPEYRGVVEVNARLLNLDRNRRVVVEGHTDERGGREYNLALGQRRAEAVRQQLTLLGVQDSQVEAVSYGKERPAVQGSNEEAWARNRRAELVYR